MYITKRRTCRFKRKKANIVSLLYSLSCQFPDISALASMKNVAKCDTWCELQNPVNHRVFERKLRPKPLGRRHACLSVTQDVAPHPLPSRGRRAGAEVGLPWTPGPAVGPNRRSPATAPATSGGTSRPSSAVARAPSAAETPETLPRPIDATSGQAGLPAEFKHINKRRKRNLPGFP